MWRLTSALWRDERGGITTLELIGYTVLIGGAAVLVGYGLSAANRGLAGKVMKAIENAAP